MPWQIDGTFIRVNPSFSGPTVWQQDKAADYKIVATRHDSHDEDLAQGIQKSLNLDGYNAMRAALDMAGYPVDNVLAATVANQAVNKAQLDQVVDAVDANTAAIAAIETSNPDNIITSFNWAANVLTGVRPGPDLTVTIKRFNEFKSAGMIRHFAQVLAYAATITINPATCGRYHVTNTGAISMTITRPSGTDTDLGDVYCAEGSIIFTNGAGGGGAVTLVGVTATKILGSQPLNANVQYVLSYQIIRTATGYQEQYVWSAPV